MRPIAGREQDVIDIFKEWDSERRPNVSVIGVAVFEDKEAYLANGNAPEQDAWFRKLRALLEPDPAWEDGEYVIG